MKYLTQTGRIGPMELKNRMILAPMGVTVGQLRREDAAFYSRRAQGGAALVFCNIKASKRFESAEHSIFFDDRTRALFSDIVEQCHAYGCKVGAQIMPGDGRIGGGSIPYKVPVSASDCPWMHVPKLKCHALTLAEIAQLEADFRDSAAAAVECGADCIEIHAYGGYLTDQFLTARWNTRTDDYGGSLENRGRFLKELIQICKEVGGADYPVIVKFTPDHCMEGTGWRTIEEGIALAKLLEAWGADALHVDAGCHENWYRAMPPMALQEIAQYEAARRVKQAVSIPVLTNGKLGDVQTAERLLAEGAFDYAVIGRGLLADPDLPNKVMAGTPEAIRPCISCNNGCIGRVYAGQGATCAVNPECGKEYLPAPTAPQPKRVLVIGGGPAGCAAALMAEAAGHKVTLWEAADRLGGTIHAAAGPYFKTDLLKLVDYYTTRLSRSSVTLRLNTPATAEAVAAFAPEAIVWAVGGQHRSADIPGMDSVTVYTLDQALTGTVPEQHLLVMGGGVSGIETALHFGKLGKTVTCAARGKLPSKPEFKMNHMLLTEMMAASPVQFYSGTVPVAFTDGTVLLQQGDKQLRLPCEAVILALGTVPTPCPFSHIAPIYPIGDADRSGNILKAVHDAWSVVAAL